MQFSDLDRSARAPLRTLSKLNAETVGRHLVMVARLIDLDPELAYEHAHAAVRSAGRVDVVREAAGIAAYRTERYAEALRELRTVRRLNGSSEHLPLMADCERGLGRPERAIALAASPEAETLSPQARVELAIVVSGARVDLGELEAAEATLAGLDLGKADQELKLRVLQAKAWVLESSGRADEAAALLATADPRALARANADEPEEDVVVYDLFEESEGAGIDGGSDGAESAVDGAGETEDTELASGEQIGSDRSGKPAQQGAPTQSEEA